MHWQMLFPVYIGAMIVGAVIRNVGSLFVDFINSLTVTFLINSI